MTEQELTARVLRAAHETGVLAHHCAVSTRCKGTPGFPDVLLLGTRGLVLAELKSANGDTSGPQDLWLWTAARAGVPAPVWRPGDLEQGTITDVLTLIR